MTLKEALLLEDCYRELKQYFKRVVTHYDEITGEFKVVLHDDLFDMEEEAELVAGETVEVMEANVTMHSNVITVNSKFYEFANSLIPIIKQFKQLV